MNKSRNNSGAFFALGSVAFVAGVAFWAVLGRGESEPFFACSAVMFAAAWGFERISQRGGDG
ncbi:hypothetical protein ACFW9F_07425 [Streptomyces sp. NPDC059506]|uniref:hypothetical protein n=1 Tax=Streptomyces sp. NPDC059506 TaxID=3347751 RepID=UPI0036CAFF76